MPNLPSLTILEEFLLLALDDQAGAFWPVPRSAFDCATAAAVLMDLMRLNRVDCDLSHIFVTNPEPTGDDILDPILQALALDPVRSTRSVTDELRFLSDEGESMRDHAVQRIIQRGVLKNEEEKIFWVFGTRRYPVQDDREIRAVKFRVVSTILGDSIPDPHDVSLVSLASASGILRSLLTTQEFHNSEARIAQIARLDILGRATAEVIADVEASIAMASGLR